MNQILLLEMFAVILIIVIVSEYFIIKTMKKGIDSERHYDGSIDIWKTSADVKVYTLNLESDPEDLDDKKYVVFKVNRN